MTKILRASSAGFPCERNLWYGVRGYAETSDESVQRIFDVGTYLEPLVVEWLKADGWEVEYNAGSQDADVEVTIPVKGGEIAGHPDCIISRGKLRNVLVDIKTMNDRAFTLWRREGTLKSKPQYVDQVHIYAAGLKAAGREIGHLGIVGMNKNNSDMYIDIFEYDAARMVGIQERAERILNASDAPEENSPRESWCCNYCGYADICARKKKAVPWKKDADEEYTEDMTVIGAMRDLLMSRELSKEARDLELQAKEFLDQHMTEQGKRRITGGGLVFRLTERTRGTFDSIAFRKEHPELAREYMKESTSQVYEVKEVGE